jgi:hypothetical protein
VSWAKHWEGIYVLFHGDVVIAYSWGELVPDVPDGIWDLVRDLAARSYPWVTEPRQALRGLLK